MFWATSHLIVEILSALHSLQRTSGFRVRAENFSIQYRSPNRRKIVCKHLHIDFDKVWPTRFWLQTFDRFSDIKLYWTSELLREELCFRDGIVGKWPVGQGAAREHDYSLEELWEYNYQIKSIKNTHSFCSRKSWAFAPWQHQRHFRRRKPCSGLLQIARFYLYVIDIMSDREGGFLNSDWVCHIWSKV